MIACLCEDKILDDLCCFLLLFQSMCLVLEEEGGNRDLQTYQRIVQPFFLIFCEHLVGILGLFVIRCFHIPKYEKRLSQDVFQLVSN